MNTKVLTRSELTLIRRKKELRNHILIAELAILPLVSLLRVFFSLKSVASDGKDYYKYYMTVEIESVESIRDLADTYAIPEMTTKDRFIKEVLFINGIESLETPISSRYIIIPYYSTIHS